MAILLDPLFGEEARGQVAKTMVFKRSAVHPVLCAFSYHRVNWTPAKIAQATTWKTLCNAWRALSQPHQAEWRRQAPGVLTGFNYFMQHAGVFPYPPCYSPPPGDSLLYHFTLLPYDVPYYDQLDFTFSECR